MNTSTIHETATQETVVWRGFTTGPSFFTTRTESGALDIDEVRDGLFGWDVVPVEDIRGSVITPDGVATVNFPRKMGVARSDTLRPFEIHSDAYGIHQPKQWLVDTLGDILDDGLSLAGAGHFKYGAVGFVQVELPDTITTRHGIDFRPMLTAATSHDGSCASTYTLAATVIVCRNTFAAAMTENPEERVRIRHTANSIARLGEIRSVLGLVHVMADEFEREVETLANQVVTDQQFEQIVAAYVGKPGESKRSQTMAENKRDALLGLWKSDPMVAPWAGSKWGAMQAISTFEHHLQIVRGSDRTTRNAERMVMGGAERENASALALINRVVG